MRNYFIIKYIITKLREYIFIFLTATIFLFTSFSKSFSEENVFILDNIEVKGIIDINFSRDAYINRAFLDSFEILISKILVSSDYNKINNIKLNDVKNLINSFQILEETYRKDEYKAIFKIFYNELEVKKFLSSKNISFSQPKKISAVFYPVLFVEDEFKNFNENYFYKKWNEVKIKNELISFILPIEDIDDIRNIKEIKNNFEILDIGHIINKYNTKNYVFAFIQKRNKKLNIYLKTNLNNNKTSKNISYYINDINNELELEKILKNLKKESVDIWKAENVINISIPLSIRIKFENSKPKKIEDLKSAFKKISIIDNYFLEEFNVKHSFFKIYYYGNPKKLTSELLKFGYQLKNNQGNWAIY